MSVCRFSAKDHSYTIDGKRVPSVTEVVDSQFYNGWYTERSAWRGSVIHKLCEMYDRDTRGRKTLPTMEEWAARALEPGSVSDEHLLWASGWPKYLRDFKIESFEWIEKPLWSRTHGFGGTPDRISNSVIDIKTGAIQEKPAALQLAGYAILADVYDRNIIQLKPDGGYVRTKLNYSSLALDSSMFLAVLNLYKWKEN